MERVGGRPPRTVLASSSRARVIGGVTLSTSAWHQICAQRNCAMAARAGLCPSRATCARHHARLAEELGRETVVNGSHMKTRSPRQRTTVAAQTEPLELTPHTSARPPRTRTSSSTTSAVVPAVPWSIARITSRACPSREEFTEPVTLSSTQPADLPLPRTAARRRFDLLVLRARCVEEAPGEN